MEEEKDYILQFQEKDLNRVGDQNNKQVWELLNEMSAYLVKRTIYFNISRLKKEKTKTLHLQLLIKSNRKWDLNKNKKVN